MIDVEEVLRDSFRHHERGVRPSAGMLEAAVRRSSQRDRRRRVAQRLSAVVAIGGLAVAASLAANRGGTDVAVHTDAGPQLIDVGSAGQLPAHTPAVLQAPGVFVLRTSSGAIAALSSRSPKQGCRLVLASDGPDIARNPEIVFHDPCHGANFDRDGHHVGGPSPRDMYRYDAVVDGGRIIVDTTLARPGPPGAGVEGGEMSLDRLGETDDIARRWRDALIAAGEAVRAPGPHPFVWVLGAFHDDRTGVVTLPFTIDGLMGELQIGPAARIAAVVPPDGDHSSFDLEAGTLVVASAADGSVVQADMLLPTGARLRVAVLAPAGAEPPSTSIVALVDHTTSALLD